MLASAASGTRHIPQLPTELWLNILKFAVTHLNWDHTIFFPPADDFSLISGFKRASSTFYSLVEALEKSLMDRSMNVLDAGKILRDKIPLDKVRHIMIQRNVAMADYLQLLPLLTSTTSLAISFSQREFQFLGLQSYLSSTTLTRLDLSYPDVFWRPLTLDFPNLKELRLSAEKPWVKHDQPTFAPAIYTINAQRFAADLLHTVHKLQSLQHLSLHISLDHSKSYDYVLEGHLDLHTTYTSLHFSKCPQCNAEHDESWVLGQESRYSMMLGEVLPRLEKVMWLDAWREEFWDEEGMRESRVVRKGTNEEEGGGMEIWIGGRLVLPGAQIEVV